MIVSITRKQIKTILGYNRAYQMSVITCKTAKITVNTVL